MAFLNKVNGGNNLVTPKGNVEFSMINTAQDFFKEKYYHNITMSFDETTDAKFTATMEALHNAIEELPENKGKKWMPEHRLGYFEDKNGKKLWKFKTYAFEVSTDNTTPKKPVFVADKFQKPLPDTTIGRGSIAQVQFTAKWSYESKNNCGISLWLEGVMVHDLVEVGGSKMNFAFEEPKMSFVPEVAPKTTTAPSTTIGDEEIPF